MNNRGYEIDYVAKEISITKNFAKKAQNLGSPEAETMEILLGKYPAFAIKYKENEGTKKTEKYNGLSVQMMRCFFDSRIRMAAADEEKAAAAKKDLENFNKVLALLGSKQFAKIKKWFLENYKEEYKAWSITDEFNKAA